MNAKKCKEIRRAAAHCGAATDYVTEGPRTRTFERQTAAGVELHAVQITRPIYLKQGSSRRVYKTLKHLERRVGLDKVLTELKKEANA